MQISTEAYQLLSFCLLFSNTLGFYILDESNAGSYRHSDRPQKTNHNTEISFPSVCVDLLVREKGKSY